MTSSEDRSSATGVRRELTARQKRIRLGLAGLLLLAGLVVLVARPGGFPLLGSGTAAPQQPGEDAANAHDYSAWILTPSAGYQRVATYTGTIRSANRTMVAFQLPGLVREILVEEGTPVSAGQPLARLDTRRLEAQRDALTGQLNQAEARLAEMEQGPRAETIEAARSTVSDLTHQCQAARLRLERSEMLRETNAIPQQEYEQELYRVLGLEARQATARSQLDELLAGTRPEQITAQQARVRSIEAEREAVQIQLADSQLTAPFGGTVVRRWIDPGSVVDAGTPVLELIDHQNLEVHVGVPSDAHRGLHPGQEILVQAGEKPIPARLRTVLPAIDSASQTRRAVFDLEGFAEAPPTVVEGQLARVQWNQQVLGEGFWVPVAALSGDHSGLWSCLTVEPVNGQIAPGTSRTGVARKQSVEVLYQRGDWVFVRGTLQAGQWLIADGLQRVVPGQRITARPDPALQSPETPAPASKPTRAVPEGPGTGERP